MREKKKKKSRGKNTRRKAKFRGGKGRRRMGKSVIVRVILPITPRKGREEKKNAGGCALYDEVSLKRGDPPLHLSPRVRLRGKEKEEERKRKKKTYHS